MHSSNLFCQSAPLPPRPMLSLLRFLKYHYDSDIKIGTHGRRLRTECGCFVKTLFWTVLIGTQGPGKTEVTNM